MVSGEVAAYARIIVFALEEFNLNLRERIPTYLLLAKNKKLPKYIWYEGFLHQPFKHQVYFKINSVGSVIGQPQTPALNPIKVCLPKIFC